jgi:coenzyme F420-0:L-glutamate ligase / coenzyme F420-1:gamma-L-glutamate ligase
LKMALTLTPLSDIPLIKPGDALVPILLTAVESEDIQLQDRDVLVLAQKIVSKAEGRLVNLNQVNPSQRSYEIAEKAQKDPRLVELILSESREVLRVRPGTIIVEHRCGFVCANAGIDHSNVEGPWGNAEDWVLMLPEDADASARRIQKQVLEKTGRGIGVLIIDSHGRAWRIGTVGISIGAAGVPEIVDQRGWKDLFGYQLRITQVGAADELAAAASLVMGQADERVPAVHVRGFPYNFRATSIQEVIRPEGTDLFR